ncbi:DUF1249 domain-containing protein [Neptuniibacter pectenicola]|jgi:uncharacterized protein YqiB (DUF1249 family)|uniref:DUF1249 domain-containing protein n=1 Tax=Neptuniibacter pectenicola TaxID=1806669 RepID=A0ABU9TR61_9GAMM|nr:DUF1249 domain-containing protein [Neptuniibacter pectenicola]KXJ57550.1 MAG: hypothetical protein AXW15_13480 [Neptuniibacter sp. Phe_28]|tara:strand:+ start:1955 stop:2398 length:444 start_codon:yes stop_codon:yes gene_type:complete
MKRKYIPDLTRQMSQCEANYVRIMKLLPDLDNCDEREFQVSWPEHSAYLRLKVDERFKYTSTVLVSHRYETNSPWLESPGLVVRLYHDASVAEVICMQRRKQLSGAYPYPNPNMHLPDEKLQLNEYLGEWLSECLRYGHLMEIVFSG